MAMPTRKRGPSLAAAIAGVAAVLYVLVAVAAVRLGEMPPPAGLTGRWEHGGTEWVVDSVSPLSAAQDAGVHPGDTILTVDGQPLPSDSAAAAARLAKATRVEVFSAASDNVITVNAASGAPPWQALLVISAVFFVVGSVAVLRGQGEATRALTLACYAGAAELAIAPAVLWQVNWGVGIHSIALPLLISSFPYLFLVFPVRRTLNIRGLRISPIWLPVSSLAFAATWVLVIVTEPNNYQLFQRMGYPYFLACLVLGVVAVLRSWRQLRTGREAAQLRIALFGSLAAVVPFLLLNLLPLIVLGRDLVPNGITLLALVLMPVSFAYAILRYQLMDLQLFIRRGLVYSSLVLIVSGLYGLVLFLATLFLSDRSGLRTILPIALMSAVVALAGGRLQSLLQQQVDRLFDRRSYDYRRQLLEFSRRMSGILDPDDLAHSAVELISQTMAPSHVRLYVFDPATQSYQWWAGTGDDVETAERELGLHHPTVEAVTRPGELVHRLDVPPADDALIIPLTNKGQPVAVLTMGPKRADVPYSSEDLALLRTVANQLAIATDNAQLYGRMRQLYLSGIRTLAATVDAKDPYTHGHSERVAGYARAIAEQMGLPQLDIETIELAGVLHDIGKIGVPDTVLQKPGRLNPDERALIMEHAAMGARILAGNPALTSLVPLVRHHHEWFNGGGYPDGLEGTEIPLGAAIICVADTYDTMTTDRPYRKAPGREQARDEIARCSGTQFHPAVVQAFCRAVDSGSWPQQPGSGGDVSLPYDLLAGRITPLDARAMHIVYKLAQMIGEVTELDVFMQRVSDLVRRELGIGRVDIFLLREETRDLVGQLRMPGAVTGVRIPLGLGLVGWVAEHQSPARVDDVTTDPRALTFDGLERRSELAVPLATAGRTIGVIDVESRRVGVFTEDDEALLCLVAQQLAQAIEVAQLHDRMKRNASLDGLTGVANHRRFYERLEEGMAWAAERDAPLSLILIDVDGLKTVNDTYGHLAGDAALRRLADLLSQDCRADDTVARCGGDEFAVILPGLDARDAASVGDRLISQLRASTFETRGMQVPLPSVSWGTATFPIDGDRPVTIVAAADERMYLRKKDGRGSTRGPFPLIAS
ncbi:MAG TPA: diguanylate cyclase [Thermomicrobiaceae bacterium]|nr:diguanylate cyclase [Thermomicrobiaceae bacterium]